MIRYPHIAARLFNAPLLIHPAKLDAIIAGLSGRLGIGSIEAPQPSAFTSSQGDRRDPGYRVLDSGVAILDIFGVLAHRGGLDANSSYVLGYQEIARRLDAALADGDVRGIVLNIDSPGGEVAGAFDLADKIRAARGTKPIQAVAGDLAASAAYLIASAADSIAITQTGYVGSVGVVMRHVDFSRALSNEGISVTHIFAGARKIDGNPYEPLPDGVRESFQSEVLGIYGQFVDTVAANRRMTAEGVRATEAGVFRGTEALASRLADRIATPDQVIAGMSQQVSRRTASVRLTHQRSKSMNENQADAAFTQADVDRARVAGAEEGRAAGTAEERTRIAAILTHAEAEGREPQARALAFDTDLTPEQAAKVLAASPKQPAAAAAPQPGNAFLTVMAKLGNPDVGADPPEPVNDSKAIQSAWGRAFGRA